MKSTPSQKSVVSPMEIQKIPSFDASTCPILNVVVYPDKAEVNALYENSVLNYLIFSNWPLIAMSLCLHIFIFPEILSFNKIHF